jgi:hypothetical protein
MRIEDLRSEKHGSRYRVAATVKWEENDRPAQELYFETDNEFVHCLSCNPHAFLVACIMPAWRYDEKRVFVDAEICPELRDGLITAMEWFRHWYNWYEPNRPLVKIETKKGFKASVPATPPRAGLTFSGGIDSLAALRTNRLNYPLDHPASFKDALFVYDLEVLRPEVYKKALCSLAEITKDASVALVPVYTNIKYMSKINIELDHDPDFWEDFWQYEFMGGCLAAIAHAFSPPLNSVTIASHYDVPNIKPYGCHPLIDPNFSSSSMRIQHARLLTRFEKTKLIADWDAAVHNVRVCNRHDLHRFFAETGLVNCGKCEKCIRTMLTLLALGRLKGSRAFPADNISEEQVDSGVHFFRHQQMFPQLVTPLREAGRPDLAQAVERIIAEYNKPEWQKNLREWRQYLGVRRILRSFYKFDQKYFAGNIRKTKKFFYPSQAK